MTLDRKFGAGHLAMAGDGVIRYWVERTPENRGGHGGERDLNHKDYAEWRDEFRPTVERLQQIILGSIEPDDPVLEVIVAHCISHNGKKITIRDTKAINDEVEKRTGKPGDVWLGNENRFYKARWNNHSRSVCISEGEKVWSKDYLLSENAQQFGPRLERNKSREALAADTERLSELCQLINEYMLVRRLLREGLESIPQDMHKIRDEFLGEFYVR